MNLDVAGFRGAAVTVTAAGVHVVTDDQPVGRVASSG